MGFINSEGKFNNNWFLIDAQMFGMKGNAAIYIVENNGVRMMIDTTTPSSTIRKIMNKIKKLGLYPIHKLLITHGHWDHLDGVSNLKKIMNETEIEVLASENAIYNLEHPEIMNEEYEVSIDPIEDILPLKEGDIINLNGLELEIFNFFGHSQDLIAILDRKNKSIFSGDGIINKYDQDTFLPVFLSHEFNENQLLATFKKLREIKIEEKINSILLSHFGVWTEEDFEGITNEMEFLHHKTKDSIIQWYNENSSLDYITHKYHESFIPNSTIFTKKKIKGLKLSMQWLIEGLQMSGFL